MQPLPGPLGTSRTWRQRLRLPLWRLWFYLRPLFSNRWLDLLLSLMLLIVLSPLLLFLFISAYWRTGKLFEFQLCMGRFQHPFKRLYFAGHLPGKNLARLFNILRGDMALVGPRPLSIEEAASLTFEEQFRFSVRPGLFSVYGLRTKTGIAYEQESTLDKEQIYSETLQGNLGLMLRHGLSFFLRSHTPLPMPPILNFFGIHIINTDMEEAIAWFGKDPEQQRLLAFVNPDCLNISHQDEAYRQILQQADRVLPDGIGIHIGCRMLGVSLRANVNGTDLFPRLCQASIPRQQSLFLLGGKPGVAEKVAQNMRKQLPDLRIAGYQDGYFKAEASGQIIQQINDSGADILLVAFGVPKQEKWLHQHRHQLQAKVLMGVGGLFDFYAGCIPRAPQWLREIGMEWSWRLLQEPGRMWRRYLIGNPLFLYRVWHQKWEQQHEPPTDSQS
ncbi:Putative N-acetylmannosaminyltransferase [Candidatus Venteria ishoeyi]|uniref:Putative N-acetylmannosaminyltransferase n=2 Tax=Candidatus Venteria ishoeyi TaxID=1899563 RepID=A0A1H6FBU2_9GAMM|nr:Putative N-acetylmannosaminyltransferase [Candidatus Venteria ishoeyi]